MQIIAAAGSGKTEVVSQRVASLLADGEPAESIVAFTFTEKAAAELKERIRQRVTARVGAVGDRPARAAVRRHDPRLLLPAPPDARAAVRDLHAARPEPAHEPPLPRAGAARAQAARPEREAVQGHRGVPARASTSSRTSCSTWTTCPTATSRTSAARVLRDARRLPLHVVRHADRPRRAGARGPDDPREGHRRPAAPDRRRVPGRQPGAGAAHRAARQAARARRTSSSSATTTRRSTSGAAPTSSNIVTFAERYDGRHAVQPAGQPPLPAGHRRARQRVRADASRSGSTRRWAPSAPATARRSRSRSVIDDEQTEADAIALDIEALHKPGRPLPRHRDPGPRARRRTRRSSTRWRSRASRSSPAGARACSSSRRRRSSARRSPGSPTSTGRRAASSSARRSNCSTTCSTTTARPSTSTDDERPGALRRTSSRGSRRRYETDFGRQPRRRVLRARSSCSAYRRLGPDRRRCSATGSAPSPASPSCWPTTSRSPAARGGTPTTRASRSAARSAASGSTEPRAAPGQLRDRQLRRLRRRGGPLGDGVALGTVHGAKGLEWPVVFLPSLTDGRFPSRRSGQAADWLLPRDALRRRPLRGLRRRRAPAVLRRAHARARLGVAVVARSGDTSSRASRRRTSSKRDAARDERRPARPTPSRAGIETPDLAVTYSELDATSTARGATCSATSSASCRRSRPSSATATPCTT